MATLHWDLTKSATRTALMEATLALLHEEEQRAIVEKRDAAGVPEGHCHNIREVDAVIDDLSVSDRVKSDLHDIYRILAEAEASAHDCAVEETHFHEVGNCAGIKNALHICLAVEALNPDEIVSTAVQTGQGGVQCAHGELPIPAPATAAIIARGIPTCAEKRDGELLTPTSAAIIYHFTDRFDI